jgi:hypothetical protein
MAISFFAPAVLATAAAAAAVAFAPAAAADRDIDSRGDSGRGIAKQDTREASRPGLAFRPAPRQSAVSQVPQGWLNEAQWARPGSGANPFGSQPKPPVFALD